ncbi:MAG: hypothetical protein JEZ06_05660 [Anaerolineaceae bacterium]|nr:hypothetical protein [Anaerolineaceae bacterium]
MNPESTSTTHEYENEYHCQNTTNLEERMGYLEMAYEEMYGEPQEDKMFPKTTDAWA